MIDSVSNDTNIPCPSSLLWNPSAVDNRRSTLYVCIIASIIHFIFWLQIILFSSVRQKTMQWVYAYLVTDILILIRFFFVYIVHSISNECTPNILWANFNCYLEAFVDNYLNVTEVYILLALNICRYVQLAYNRNVYETNVRLLICAHLVIYLMPVINFIVQVSVNWVYLRPTPGDTCYIDYSGLYAHIFNTIIAFALPIILNILVIYASIRHVHLTSRLRRTQHHVTAREKYHRSLVIQFLVFYTVWLLLWSPNIIIYQLAIKRTYGTRSARLLSFIEVALDPIIIPALDIRFKKIWRNIWIRIRNYYFRKLERQRRQIHPIGHITGIPLPQRQ